MKQIYNHHWHMLTDDQVVALFTSYFQAVTYQPNFQIIDRLKTLEIATLELLENRTSSSVYRIWQTGEVYKVGGSFLKFDDYESYLKHNPEDTLLESFFTKEPVHIISKEGARIYIERKKSPRFKGLYTQNKLNIIEWIDPRPQNISELTSIMRKAGSFISNYLKHDIK